MLKRVFDVVTSAAAIAVLSPLLVPIAVLLRLTGEGKVFYVQQRVGRGGRTFGLYKFATMLENSPNMPGGDVTEANDPRVLPAGRFLRKTKINELPQLLNILRGDMSVVGPRPLTPRTFAMYPENVQREISDLQPGLTGIGSIVFRDEEAILASSPKPKMDCFREDIAPYKGTLELWYKERRGFALDLLLIALTVAAVASPRSSLHTKVLRDLPRQDLPRV
jgi:lipopolysaccharide/colanic/teichoic acid biosynthesis glycosyltransferase